MGKVKELNSEVAGKIAAGEVVERPLSVVKELVENALDAGADTIDVEIREGGKQLIRVTDNGEGFDPGDVELAFKRHSTSKLTHIEDFNTLLTLGFRGEALPSILEVSKITLKTSNNRDGKGVAFYFTGNRLEEQEEIAFHQGTQVEVQDLFYNFPVRKKFLKSERSELNQIVAYLEQAALANYEVSFSLSNNSKTLFIYNKTAALKERVYQVFGKEFLDHLQEVDFDYHRYHLHGFISKVNTGISVKKHQYFFVNKRPIREKTLFAALNNTFRNFLEKSKSPVAVLTLDIPADEIDVNIHPMKLEIKFENSNQVYQFIKHAVESACRGTTITPGSEPFIPDPLDFLNQGRGRDSGESYTAPATAGGMGPYVPGRASDRSTVSGISFNPGDEFESEGGAGSDPGMPGATAVMPGQGPGPGEDSFNQGQLFESGFHHIEHGFYLIGQYRNSYIVIEKEGDLLIVDQHNADERINFDRLKKQYREKKVTSITPLFPIVIELTPSEISLLDEQKQDILEKVGFDLRSLGGNSFDVKSFPQILDERRIKDVILEIIHLQHGEADFEDKVLAEVACKSSIKVNHRLHPEQMRSIVRDLFKSSNPYFCPHKRPVIVEFSHEKIEKLLKRK